MTRNWHYQSHSHPLKSKVGNYRNHKNTTEKYDAKRIWDKVRIKGSEIDPTEFKTEWVATSNCVYSASLLIRTEGPGLEVIKRFSCSAQFRLKFTLLINVKMPTIVGILTFISRINYRLCQSKPKISINLG